MACSAGGLGLPQTLQRERQDRRYSERHCEGSHRPVGRDVLGERVNRPWSLGAAMAPRRPPTMMAACVSPMTVAEDPWRRTRVSR